MGKVEINVSEFYGVTAYYSVMPRDIFDALELAALNGEQTAIVDQEQFDMMLSDYKKKVA